jgi:hypothetical protein
MKVENTLAYWGIELITSAKSVFVLGRDLLYPRKSFEAKFSSLSISTDTFELKL